MDTEMFNGFPTHIDRVGDLLRISVQKEHKLGRFVENYLLEHIKDLKSVRYVPKKEDIQSGMIGIGRYDDNQYYRIRVIDQQLRGNVVNVIFIDYGNHGFLALSDIRLLHYEIHKALLNIPPLAITCFLEKVTINKPWNDEEFSTLKKLVLYEERQCIIRHLPAGIKVINIYFHNANKRLTEMILENDMGTHVSDNELMEHVKKLSSRGLDVPATTQPTSNLQQYSQRLQSVNENYISARTFPDRILQRENFSSAHMLPVDSSYNVYVSHMEDGPYSFSIQLKSTAEDALPRLTMLLKQDELVLNTRPLLPGTLVMTNVYGENNFRRSIVMNVKRNFCQVYHMDYGSTEEVPFSEIYQLPSQAQHAPAMALRFCLADIKNTQITDAAKAYFQDLLLNKQVLIKVAPQESEGPLLQYCEMFYEGRNVKDILAAFSAPLEYTSQHPPRGKDIKVTVSHIHSPSLFFIQYNSKLDIINRIQESVEAHCKNQPRLRDFSTVSIGTPVAALFEDNVWYRGMIVGLKGDTAQVLYVDYGNRSNVPANHLCQISRELVTQWRAQAVECCLQGFENENTNDVSQQVSDVMEETLNQNFNLTPLLILPGNRYVVELVDELGGKLSEKLNQVKAQSSQIHAAQVKPSQEASLSDLDVLPVDSGQRGNKSKGKSDNMFVRPSLRPLLEQNKPYSEHDDRCDDVKLKGLNRQSSFERSSRFKSDDYPRKGRDSFDERKSSHKFNDKPDDWAHDQNFGNNRDNFSHTPSRDNFSKPSFPKSTSNEEDDRPKRGPREKPGNSDTQKSFGRPNRNNWEEGSDKNDSLPKWNSSFDNSRNEDRTRQNRGNDRPRFRVGEEIAPQRHDNDENSGRNEDKPKWSGEKDNDRPRRDGGIRFNERKQGAGDFGGNKYSGKRTIEEMDAGERFGDTRQSEGDLGANRFGDRRRNDGESVGNRYGDRRRNDGEFGGNRFGESGSNKFGHGEGGGNRYGDRRRDDGEGGGNRFGDRRRDDGEGGGNRFNDRRRDDGEPGGNRYDRRRDDGEAGGNRFGDRRRDDGEGGGNRFGDRRREDGAPRFADKRRDDGEGGPRFGGRRGPREDVEGGGNNRYDRKRDDGNERRGGGGRFRDADGSGRREGGRFNNDNNDFRKKRFDSDFAAPNKSINNVSSDGNVNEEDWGEAQGNVDTTPETVDTIQKSTIGATYPTRVISTNAELQVLVSSVVNPHFFYVQEAGCEPALDQLRSDIENLGQTLKPIKEDFLAPGVPVLARFSEDQAIYRGIVKQLVPSSKARILFVDFGNFEVVPFSELYYIPPEILNKPPLAIQCTIPDINPLNQGWHDDPTAFDAYLNGEEILTMSVISVKMIDAEVVIAARFTNSNGTSISQLLIEGGLAIPPSGSAATDTCVPQGKPVHVDNPADYKLKEADQISDEWVDQMNLLVGQTFYGQILEDAGLRTYIIRLFDARVTALASLVQHQCAVCEPGSKVIISIEGVLEDRLLVAVYDLDGIEKGPFVAENIDPRKISPVLPFPVIRKVERVCIVYVEGTDIYIQRLADTVKLNELLDEMYNFYNNTVVDHTDWSVGDLCCGKSLLDENWYRSEIISIDGDTYNVKYLDYGSCEELPKEMLRKLDKRFYFPHFSLCVSLPVDWKTPKPSLFDIAESEEFLSKLIYVNERWMADLTFSSGKRLNDMLLEKNIAQEKSDSPFKEINSAIGLDLRCGSKIPILVSHADSPSMFWAHMLTHINKVDELQEKLQEVVGDAQEANDKDVVFAAKYSADNVWYRATRVNAETLRFIDYGNTDALLPPIKKLPDEMIRPSSGYAIPMYLCVKPVNGDWTDEAIKEFEIFIEQQNIVAEIINVDYKVVVDLREGEKLLSKILIDSGHAVYCDFIPEKFKKYSKESFSDSFFQRIFAEVPHKSAKIQCDTKVQGASKTSHLEGAKVYITHSNSLNDFYIQDDSKTVLLDEIQTGLFEIEETEKVSEVNKGQLYGIKYTDEMWYRGKVISTEPEINLLLVDYGNTYATSDLRPIPDNLVHFEPLAVHCSLNVEESPEAYSKFVKLTNNGQTPFNMKVLRPGSPSVVQLLDDEGSDILTHLGVQSLNISTLRETGSLQKIFITHVYGPECFYAQTEEQLSKLEELSVQMSRAEDFKKLQRILEGDIIAALFEDDSCWYRVEVLAFAPNVVGRFMDYGNTAIVHEYRELPPEMKAIECLTTKCSLKLPEGVEHWPEGSAELLATTCAMNPEAMQMQYISESEGIVELYLNGEALSKTIVDLLSAPIDEIYEDGEEITTKSETVNNEISECNKAGRGYITHINSISDFYIQKEDCADLLSQIQNGLSALQSSPDGKPDCGIGSLIATKFVDGEWYRGEILQIDPEIRVRFIDYGNECNVSEISALSEELCKIPPVAMKCSLEVKNKNLKDDARKLFKKLCDNAETLFDFTIKSVDGGLNIVEIILDNKNVLSYLCQEYPGSEIPEEKISASEKTSVLDDTSELIGKEIKGYVSHINSINDFFIQEESSTETLKEIQSGLVECCNVDRTPTMYGIGDLLGAKFTDGNWYRAEVTEKTPELKVRLIDYGNESNVSEISELNSHLLEIPGIALRCSLETEGLCIKDKLNDKFTNICGNNKTLFHFLIVSNRNGLNIVNVLLDGEDICLDLTKSTSVEDIQQLEIKDCTSSNPENDISNIESEPSSVAEAVANQEEELPNGIENNDMTSDIHSSVPNNSEVKPSEEFQDTEEILSKDLNNSSDQPKISITTLNSIEDFFIVISDKELKLIEVALLEAELFEDPSGIDVGDILAGKAADGKWFRCKIEDASPDNYQVFLLDYGNRISVTKLKDLPSNLIIIEPKSLHCRLYCPDGISHWPKEMSNRFTNMSEYIVDYTIVDDSVFPHIVKLSTIEGDVSNILAEYYKKTCVDTNCSESEDAICSSEQTLHKDETVSADAICSSEQTLHKDETVSAESNSSSRDPSAREDKQSLDKKAGSKKDERKSLPSKPVKSLAEIKANAKSKIVTRSQGASPIDRKMVKSEFRSPSEPQLQELQTSEKLQPLFVRTSSLDERPVPGCLSNPSSPLPPETSNNELCSSSSPNNTSDSPVTQSSPRHSVSDKIVPGSISGRVIDDSKE